MGSFGISWLQEDVSGGQGDDLLPGWASWKEEEEEEGCQRGEGPGYTRPCRRPGQSPCLEEELGEPGASSCSSYSPSTSPLWGRAHGRKDRRGSSHHPHLQSSGRGTHLDPGELKVLELGLGLAEILSWPLMLEYRRGREPNRGFSSRIVSWVHNSPYRKRGP